MTDNPLARIPVITQAILKSQPLYVHSGQMSYLEGLQVTADKIESTLEVKNDIGEALLRLYRDAGQRFSVEFPRGGDGSNQYGNKEQTVPKKRLADYGYKPRRAAMCRKIASIPEELFESEIMSIRLGEHKSEREIITKYFVDKVALFDRLRKAGINTDRPQATTIHTPESIAALAREHLDTQQITRLIDILKG